MNQNTHHYALKHQIRQKLEELYGAAHSDLDLAANVIAIRISEAYAQNDIASAEESIEQLDLLGEIQRLRLNRGALDLLRSSLQFAVRLLFTSLPSPR